MINNLILVLSISAVVIIAVSTFINYKGVYVDRIEILRARLRGALLSKTMWFNAVALVFVDQLPQLIDYTASNLPTLQPYIPANHYNMVIGVITVVNLILRYKTKHPLEAK